MKKRPLWLFIEVFRRIFFIIPKMPEVAQIEITNRCNFTCKMCQRYDLKVPIKNMDFKLYKKIVDKLDSINEVILTGWGEPFMHSQIFEMITYAKSRGKTVSLTSNGSLLTDKITKQIIESGLDSISFSVDDIKAPKNSLVHPTTVQIKNIEKFLKKIRSGDIEMTVTIQSTLHKYQENNIFAVVKWASQVKADMVNINRLDMRFNQELKRPSYNEEKKFVNQLIKVSDKYNIQTDFRPHIAFTGLTRILYRLLVPFMGLGGRHCLRIYNYIYINMSGQVTPCCGIPLWSAGNLLKENVDSIWFGNKFNKFRNSKFQEAICGKCDVLEVKQAS